MVSEKEWVYEVEIEVEDLNENKILKPYAYQRLIAKVAEEHLKRLNMDVDTIMKYNLSWVLISLSIEIVRPVEGCDRLYATTWYSKRKGPYFRREMVFSNEMGEVFKASSFSILLDIENRSIFREKEPPFTVNEPIEEFVLEASPNFKYTGDYKKTDVRRVFNSFIDCNGHVNNCRYGEFAYDVFNDDERRKLKDLKRMDIYFHSELMLNDRFSVLKAYDNNKLLIRGFNENKGVNSFDIVLEFK